MTKTRAATVMRAAEKARLADRRVTEAQSALRKALKARDRAEAQYLALVQETFPVRAAAAPDMSQGGVQPSP